MAGNNLLHDIDDVPQSETEAQSFSRRLSAASEAHQRELNRISHDLRGPLTVVVGFIDVLSSGTPGQLNPAQLEIIGHIRTEALAIQGIALRIYHQVTRS